ncbi:hypothetical protein SPOG_01601 [Schizosaccharomyces cryophilus OY26]|uniref:Uncharacterized protein n=1 Tax=Schizosaccharomyces cryophilus (strain OY26 / ATCC MYA-4695 / CBS 11777 / NBRC 106824 / NRRL Y48691) TaxID=653667 RepID=S9X585_SCHCR|nr:uncharacterized protein SPOG_01601 [Schizosaccharomyces cryophilus OY26]EPY52262.1 hypothetical protein SPOG_01601 [Schizosaccharomyces cryophilus OY26]
MNEKLLELAKAAESSCRVSSASSDTYLPQYSELPYSHLDDLEKGCLCLHPNLVPENKSDELSIDASAAKCLDYWDAFCDKVKSGFLYISSPAAFARIPPAAKKTINEGLRVFWCFLFPLILDFSFSYYVLNYLKNNMLKDTSKKAQYGVAAILIVLAFWFSLNLVSVLLDSFFLLMEFLSGWVAYIIGYELTFEGTESTEGNQLPLHAIPPENIDESNDLIASEMRNHLLNVSNSMQDNKNRVT